LAVRADGKKVTTIEGLKEDGKLHRLQQAFIDEGAVQCGFCTPGMLLSSAALLEENPHPTEGQVREALVGNLCRCTGYARIVRAVMAAAD
jgi:carbon-monoxide dehydrogenase small subunit